jgi:hypothetical protein
MSTVEKDFDSYQIWYYSGHPYEALVYCYQGASYAGRIVFFKDDLPYSSQCELPKRAVDPLSS